MITNARVVLAMLSNGGLILGTATESVCVFQGLNDLQKERKKEIKKKINPAFPTTKKL